MTDIPPLDEFNQNILRSDTHYLTQLATHEKTHFDELMAHFDRADAWHISDTNVRIRQTDLQQMKNSLHTIPYIPEPIYHKSELENIAQEKRYLVEELPFATGGMSAVFKGIDLKMNRLVAIKCLFDEEVQEDQHHISTIRQNVRQKLWPVSTIPILPKYIIILNFQRLPMKRLKEFTALFLLLSWNILNPKQTLV